MIPLAGHLRALVHAFFYDELAFTRWCRGAMLALAAGGVAFADQLAEVLGDGHSVLLVHGIKIVSLVAGFVGGAITAGERNQGPPSQQP